MLSLGKEEKSRVLIMYLDLMFWLSLTTYNNSRSQQRMDYNSLFCHSPYYHYPQIFSDPHSLSPYTYLVPSFSSPQFHHYAFSFPSTAPAEEESQQTPEPSKAPQSTPHSIRSSRRSALKVPDRQNQRLRKQMHRMEGDQKENRNVYSNILRNFFRKVNDASKIEASVSKTIELRHLTISTKLFQEFVRKMKVDHSKYIRIKAVRPYFLDQYSPECSLVLRVLFKHYAEDELAVQTLTSRKISRSSVQSHMEGIRVLGERLFNFYS